VSELSDFAIIRQRFSRSFMRKNRRRGKQAERFYKEPNRTAKQGRKKDEANYRGQKIIFCVFKHRVSVPKKKRTR
jgi:hypothetical protein